MRTFLKTILAILLVVKCVQAEAQPVRYSANTGHSHNDYEQDIPFLKAYYAGMGSIEADVFLRKGVLMVAHDEKDIRQENTLDKLYLKQIAERFHENRNKIYPDPRKKLQLLIDIKEQYGDVIPALVKLLSSYPGVFDIAGNEHAVRIVITGNTPPAERFSDYPDFIFFDGRPDKHYTEGQLAKIAMISASLSDYSKWNGKGTPTVEDAKKLDRIIKQAHEWKKPFRFWATKDGPNTWIELEKMGVDWIGTDHPEELRQFYARRTSLQYTNPQPYPIYNPDYRNDGRNVKPKNIILLIGDGMGLAQIQAALTANYGALNLAMFRFIGLSRTEASDTDFTDSAAGGTAIACGKKTNNRHIAVDTSGNPLRSLADILSAYKMKIGIISSGNITDATPAVFYAHQRDRSMEHEIAADFPGSHVDVLVGPGRKRFTQNPDRQLMTRIAEKGYAYSKSLEEFAAAGPGKHLVLVDDSVCRPVRRGRGNMLTTSLEQTIRLFSGNKEGFFIMAEGAQIDYGGHSRNLPYVVTELHDFDRMVGEALRFADEDGETLVIVTADHETGGLTFQDASYRKGMIRGSFSTNDHTNIMVPVFAYGPGAAGFTGIYKNTEIHNKILEALGRK